MGFVTLKDKDIFKTWWRESLWQAMLHVESKYIFNSATKETHLSYQRSSPIRFSDPGILFISTVIGFIWDIPCPLTGSYCRILGTNKYTPENMKGLCSYSSLENKNTKKNLSDQSK